MMMSCLIVVQLASTAVFKHAEFDVENAEQAERLAALHAGELSSQGKDGPSRFGFRCGDREWVAVDLEFADAFSDPHYKKVKSAKSGS